MRRAISNRDVALGPVAALLLIAALSLSATYVAPAPGANLEPVNGAEVLVELVQGQRATLWSTLSGPVTKIETLGWPSTDGAHELGGAMMLEQPSNGMAGVVEFGEKPMSMTFELDS